MTDEVLDGQSYFGYRTSNATQPHNIVEARANILIKEKAKGRGEVNAAGAEGAVDLGYAEYWAESQGADGEQGCLLGTKENKPHIAVLRTS